MWTIDDSLKIPAEGTAHLCEEGSLGEERLEIPQILQELSPETRTLLQQLIVLDSVDSTNDYLLKLAHNPQVIACFAEQQTAGKGRRGKQWVCPPYTQVALSILWPFPKAASQLMGLSLAIGIAAVRGLRRYGVGDGLAVKWPNDLYYQGRKLGGILVEMAHGDSNFCPAVIGIGINLYLTPQQGAVIEQSWINLYQIMRENIARNRVAGLLLNEILLALSQFSAEGLAPFQEEWRTVDYLFNQQITLSSPQQQLTGVMQGIGTQGELLLLDDALQIHCCLNGTARLTRM